MGTLKKRHLAKKNNGVPNLKVAAEKLRTGLIRAKNWCARKSTVPKDVRKGYFAVIAADDDEERRFVVPLTYLDWPLFQRLLERAAEEYGFDHGGALMVLCMPSELEWMLANRESSSRDDMCL